MLSVPVQSVLYAALTKSVGSGFRIADDWLAPPVARQATLKRESLLLAMTTLSTAALQAGFGSLLWSRLRADQRLRGVELLLRGVITVPALVLAEWTSRRWAPKTRPLPASPLTVVGVRGENPFAKTALLPPQLPASAPVAVPPANGLASTAASSVLPPQPPPLPRQESFR